MTFQKKLEAIVAKNNSLLSVGLDSSIEKIPQHIGKKKYPQFHFNKAIIDATAGLVCAFKPNSAFYEARGADGITELKMTCDYIRKTHPDIVIILDAKRADIGSTNEGYVHFAFDYLGADAMTLHPYLGKEALTPFLDRKEKGCIILCKTSNPGAGELQDLKTGGKPLYQIIAEKVASEWNDNHNCALVVGATYPKELKIVRRIVGDMPLLIPGIGVQGADLKDTIEAGQDSRGAGMIISASRSIIFASNDRNFAHIAREESKKMKRRINQYRL